VMGRRSLRRGRYERLITEFLQWLHGGSAQAQPFNDERVLMGLYQLHKRGKRQARCIEARPLWLRRSPTKSKKRAAVTHLNQQFSALRADEGATETLQTA